MEQNYKGGYQIINLGNKDILTNDEVVDIYKHLEENYKKPILLEGINIDGVEKEARFVNVHVDESAYVIEDVYGYDIVVASDDTISTREHGEYLPIAGLVLDGSELIEGELQRTTIDNIGVNYPVLVKFTSYDTWILFNVTDDAYAHECVSGASHKDETIEAIRVLK